MKNWNELLKGHLNGLIEFRVIEGTESVRPEMDAWVRDWNMAAAPFQTQDAAKLDKAKELTLEREAHHHNTLQDEHRAWKNVDGPLKRARFVLNVVDEGVNQYGPDKTLAEMLPPDWMQKVYYPAWAKQAKDENLTLRRGYTLDIHGYPWNVCRLHADSSWVYAGAEAKNGKLVEPILAIVPSRADVKRFTGEDDEWWSHGTLRSDFDVKQTWGEALEGLTEEVDALRQDADVKWEAVIRRLGKREILRGVLEYYYESWVVPVLPDRDNAKTAANGESFKELGETLEEKKKRAREMYPGLRDRLGAEGAFKYLSENEFREVTANTIKRHWIYGGKKNE